MLVDLIGGRRATLHCRVATGSSTTSRGYPAGLCLPPKRIGQVVTDVQLATGLLTDIDARSAGAPDPRSLARAGARRDIGRCSLDDGVAMAAGAPTTTTGARQHRGHRRLTGRRACLTWDDTNEWTRPREVTVCMTG